MRMKGYRYTALFLCVLFLIFMIPPEGSAEKEDTGTSSLAGKAVVEKASPSLSMPDAGTVLPEDTPASKGTPGGPMQRRYDPVEVRGTYLDSFLGRELQRFSLFRWNQASFQAVPFQIDERTVEGKMVLPLGPEGRPQDGNNLLDPEDDLVFMVSDAGYKAPESAMQSLPGQTREIELTDPARNEKGYLYLNWDSRRDAPEINESKVKLVEGSETEPYALEYKTGIVRGRLNKIGNTVYQTPLYDSWICRPEAGGSGRDLLDAMKVRLKLGFLFNTIKVSFDETSILGGIDSLKIGPVRGAGRFWMRGVLPLGIKSPRAYMDVYLYDTLVLVPGQFKVSGGKKHLLSSMDLMVGYDLSEEAKGMKFYNSNNPDGFLIDGKMSEKEKEMDTRLDEWRVVVGPQGAMITASVWDDSYKEQADIRVRYRDDVEVEMPPEEEPGSMGFHYNTSKVKKLKEGTYHTLLCWFYPENMYDPDRLRLDVIQEYMDIRKRPVVIRVGEHEFPNPGGWPPMIDPAG